MLSTFLLIEKMGKNLWWRYVAQIFSNFVTNKEKFLPLILLFRDLRAIHMKEGFDICSMFVDHKKILLQMTKFDLELREYLH